MNELHRHRSKKESVLRTDRRGANLTMFVFELIRRLKSFVVLSLLFLICTIDARSVLAQNSNRASKIRRFKEGDVVWFFYRGKSCEGEILEINRKTKKAQLAFEFDDRDRFEIYSLSKLKYNWEKNALTAVRTWHDQKGNQINGAMMKIDETTVKLRKIDSEKLITVPVEKLSRSDQQYLERYRESKREKPKPPPPPSELPEPMELSPPEKTIAKGHFDPPIGLEKMKPDARKRLIELQPGGVVFERYATNRSLSLLKPIGGSKGWLLACTYDDRRFGTIN